MVLPDRIELSTSPLPRECSTTELRQRRVGSRRCNAGGQVGGRNTRRASAWQGSTVALHRNIEAGLSFPQQHKREVIIMRSLLLATATVAALAAAPAVPTLAQSTKSSQGTASSGDAKFIEHVARN